MTTTPPEAPTGPAGPGGPGPDEGPRVTGEEMRDLGRLRRTTYDRKVAGVAGGIARHFDIDPIIVRVAFVVLAFFGGAGLIVYAACWLLLPEDVTNTAKVRLDERSRTVALILVGTLAFLALLGDSWGGWGFPWPLFIIGLIVFIVLSARRHRDPVPPPPPTGYPVGPPIPPPNYAAAVRRERSNPRKRGPILFWFTMALVALGLGILGLIEAAGADVVYSAYPALALAIIGVMLVIGAFFGRAGGLIAAGVVAAVVTGFSLADAEVDTGTLRDTPTVAAAVNDDYEIGIGEVELDLTEVQDLDALDGRVIRLDATVGRIEVILPEGVDAEVVATIDGAGSTELFGDQTDGTADAFHGNPADGEPFVTILAEVTLGEIVVDSAERTGR